MKKNDFIIVGILLVMMFGWMKISPEIQKKYFPQPEPPVAKQPVESASAPAASDEPSAPALGAPPAGAVVDAVLDDAQALLPEEILYLSSANIELAVSSHGGAVVSAVLKDYPAENKKDSAPLMLDFAAAPALRYAGLPVAAGTLVEADGGLVYTAPLGSGLVFERTLRLDGEYGLTIDDQFINSSDVPWVLPALRLPTGFMSNPEGVSAMKGISTLGVDTFTVLEGATHLGKKFRKFGQGQLEFTSTPESVPSYPVDWIAAKNKFFVQILTPAQGTATGFDLSLKRDGQGKKMVETEVAAALQFGSTLVNAGQTVSRTTKAYIGPKDYTFLKTQDLEQIEVMEFKNTGAFKFMNIIMFPFKKAILWGLVHLHMVVRNYGLAIILLTLIIKGIMWPLTHKGTARMQEMQAKMKPLQPEIAKINEKHKANPRLKQEAMAALYKEHDVNPAAMMGGCLPMLIQIPVFFGLFSVLRSAIELRFSKFLWIRDLSEPENILHGMIPVIGSINTLPVLVAGIMMWQQKLTPSAGDPQQQKMMAVMMPVMMLFFFYTMPSGLLLYMCVSYGLMIAQMLLKKKKAA